MEVRRAARGVETPAGERKQVAALFVDLTGYTALASRLDPEDVHAFLAPLMVALRRIVEGYGGVVLGEMGDGFFAAFGVPAALEDDAERAVRAALAARDHVAALNEDRGDAFAIPDVHAGINHGEVFVTVGDHPTVLGDAVNVASRLADAAPGGTVLVSEAVHARTRHAIRYGARASGRVKGKEVPVDRYEAIGVLSDEPSARASWHPVGLVGRGAVLERLHQGIVAAAAQGSARVTVVVGEAGAGKTRLAVELRTKTGDAVVLAGRCVPYGQRSPLSPVAAAVADHLGIAVRRPMEIVDADVERAATRLVGARAAPGLASQIHALLGSTRNDGDPWEPADVGAAARAVLAALGRRKPVALLLDDLHWADPDLLAFLQGLTGWEQPVAVIGFARPASPAAERFPAVVLDALGTRDMRALLGLLLGGRVSPDVARALLARAAGNPLFLEESARMVVETGAIERRDGVWRVVRPEQLDAVPDSIRSLISARIDELDPKAKRVLSAASVCGAVVLEPLLAHLLGAEVMRAGLPVLIERDLVRPIPASSPGGVATYGFRHVVVRETAYAAVSRAERAAAHLAIAGWLSENAGDERAIEVAQHYELAWQLRPRGSGDPAVASRAVAALMRWGDEVHARQARLAGSVYERAWAIAREAGDAVDPALRCRLLVALAEALCELGRPAEALEATTKARALVRAQRDPMLEARALLAEGQARSDIGDVGEARAHLERARSIAAANGDLRAQIDALARLSETWRFDDYAREVDHVREAYRLAVDGNDRAARAALAQHLALLLSPCGGQEFLDRFEEAVKLVSDEGDLRSRANILRAWCYYAMNCWRFEDAISTAREARPLAAEAGARTAEADALLTEALATLGTGPPEAARALVEEVLAVADELAARGLRSRGLRALGLLALARAELRSGQTQRAIRRLAAGRRLLVQEQVPVQLVEADLAAAAIALDRGDWQGVARPLARAAEPIVTGGWTLLEAVPPLFLGRARLLAGAHAEAAELLAHAHDVAEAIDAGGVRVVARAARDQAQVLAGTRTRLRAAPRQAPREAVAIRRETDGLLALRRGDERAAAASFGEAVEMWRMLGLSASLARALAAQGRCLAATGNRAAAKRATDEARSMLEQLATPTRNRDRILAGLA